MRVNILCSGLRRAASSLLMTGRWRPHIASARTISAHPQKFAEGEERWRTRDRVPQGWELIYKGPMDEVLNAFSTFVTASSVIIAGVGVYYYTSLHDPTAPIVLGTSDVVVANNLEELMIYIAAFIGLHMVIKIFLSRYVIRLYKNEDKYVAIFRGHLYNQINKHEFHVKEFEKLKPTTFVGWGQSRYALGVRKGILLDDYFKTPRHLRVMLHHKDINE